MVWVLSVVGVSIAVFIIYFVTAWVKLLPFARRLAKRLPEAEQFEQMKRQGQKIEERQEQLRKRLKNSPHPRNDVEVIEYEKLSQEYAQSVRDYENVFLPYKKAIEEAEKQL